MIYCVHCGAGLRPGKRSCRLCGSIPSLADHGREDRACRVCGSPQAASWRHCAICGTATVRAGRSTITKTTIAAKAGRLRLRNAPEPDAADTGYDPGENRWPAELHPRL